MTNCVWCTEAIADVDTAPTIIATLKLHGLSKERRRYKLHYHPQCLQAFQEHQLKTAKEKADFPSSGKLTAFQ